MRRFRLNPRFPGYGAFALGLGIFCALLLLIALEQGQKPGFQDFPLKPVEALATPVPDYGKKLNLNTATREELMTLPGIGAHLAEQIIAQRELQPFHFIQDLKAVKGIGDRRIEALADLAYVPLPEGFE